MERVSFDIERQEVAEALHQSAEAHGRSVAEELAALVEQTYVPPKAKPANTNWIRELVDIANGAELKMPEWRGSERMAPQYPEGMEPLPNESFVDHITRISRPGFDLGDERDRTPHEGPRL